MTDSWKSDEITAAVQMMDTTHVPCITRDAVRNKNNLLTINKSDVHEPVDSDTEIIFIMAENEGLMCAVPSVDCRAVPQSLVTRTPVRTVMTNDDDTDETIIEPN